jgi:hypothetical protein
MELLKNSITSFSNKELIDELSRRDINLLRVVENSELEYHFSGITKSELKEVVAYSRRNLDHNFDQLFEDAYHEIEWMNLDVYLIEFMTEYVNNLIDELN